MSIKQDGRRITVHEAQLKTAAVEVKVLTISGKQVTMAVFRQLQSEELIDYDTADLRGVPWGRVNYFFGDCKPDHLHIVWQTGNELRRACVFAPGKNIGEEGFWPADSPSWEEKEKARSLFLDWVIWAIAEREPWIEKNIEGHWNPYDHEVDVHLNNEYLKVTVPEDTFNLYRLHYKNDTQVHPNNSQAWRKSQGLGEMYGETFQEHYQAYLAQKEAQQVAAFTQTYGTRKRLLQLLDEQTTRMQAHRAHYKQTYEALCALDQLFIAV